MCPSPHQTRHTWSSLNHWSAPHCLEQKVGRVGIDAYLAQDTIVREVEHGIKSQIAVKKIIDTLSMGFLIPPVSHYHQRYKRAKMAEMLTFLFSSKDLTLSK